MAASLEERGHLQDAAAVYLTFIRRTLDVAEDPSTQPGFARALGQTAYFLSALGATAQAIRCYDQVINVFDDHKSDEFVCDVAAAFFNKGILKKKLGKIEEALALLW